MKGNKGKGEKMGEISVSMTKHERHLTLGNEQGVVTGKWAWGWGDWVMGNEGGT